MADGYNAWSAEDAQFVLRQAAADAGSAAQSAANDAQSRQDPLRSPPDFHRRHSRTHLLADIRRCRYRHDGDVPPDRGQRLVVVVVRDALPRHAIGREAFLDCGVVVQREHGKDPVQQAVPRRGELCGVPDGQYGHGALLRMRPAGACRRERTAAFGVSGPAPGRSRIDTAPCGIEVSDASSRPARSPFPYSVAAASAFKGRDVGGPWRDPEDPGVGSLSVPEGEPPVRARDASHGADRARQSSVRKRAGQVPPGRAAVLGGGTDRVGPPAQTSARPAAARRAAEYDNPHLLA